MKTARQVKKKKKKAPSRVTALVRRPPRAIAPVVEPQQIAADGSLQLGALGLVELKLTAHEEAVLSEAVNPADVSWRQSKKHGPKDVPYLSHPVYTRWLNRAFGRTGWILKPIGKPVKDPQTNVVLMPYILHVHGKPIAFAWGEQEYFDRKADGTDNRSQSYGDVIESTHASALRRCVKHLGVGSELWDKRWIGGLPRYVEGTVEPQDAGRRRESPPPEPAAHSMLDVAISQEKRQRFWTISRRVGRSDAEVQLWLKSKGVKRSSDITNRQYDLFVSAIERRGTLQ